MTELKHHLATRRSISIPDIKAPAPEGEELDQIPVSYTHLTLPTILLV